MAVRATLNHTANALILQTISADSADVWLYTLSLLTIHFSMPDDSNQYDAYYPETDEEEFDEEEYSRAARRQQRRERAGRYARRAYESEQVRRVGRYYWRNRKRLRRATQLHYQFTKRFVKKQGARGLFKIAVRALFGEVFGSVLIFLAGLAIAFVVIILLMFFIIVALRQDTTGGAYVPGVPGSGPPGGPFGPPVDVQVSKTVTPDKIELNTAAEVTYTVEVTNNLEEPLENLVFADTLASGVPCEISGATLGSGESASCSYRSNIEPQAQATRIINDVTILGVSGGVEHQGLASATVTVGTPPVDAPCGYPAQGRFTQGCQESHAPDLATDIAAAEGVTPVIATMSGVGKRCVLTTRQGDPLGSGRSGSYGIYVVIENEGYSSLYAHLYPEAGDCARSLQNGYCVQQRGSYRVCRKYR